MNKEVVVTGTLNQLMDVPLEKWNRHGIRLLAASATAGGKVRSFIVKVNGRKWYGYMNWKTNKYNIEPA